MAQILGDDPDAFTSTIRVEYNSGLGWRLYEDGHDSW